MSSRIVYAPPLAACLLSLLLQPLAASAQGSPSTNRAPSGTFTVQIGAFSQRNNAERVLAELAKSHDDGRVVPAVVGEREIFRVLSGMFPSRPDAAARERDLARRGHTTYVRRLSGAEVSVTPTRPVGLRVGVPVAQRWFGTPENDGPSGHPARPSLPIALAGLYGEPDRVRAGVTEESERSDSDLARRWLRDDEAPNLAAGERHGHGVRMRSEALDGRVTADAVYDRQSVADEAMDLHVRATALDGRLRAKARYDAATGRGALGSWARPKDEEDEHLRRSLDLAFDIASLRTSVLGREAVLTATARHLQPLDDGSMASEMQLRGDVGGLGVKVSQRWDAERKNGEGKLLAYERNTTAIGTSMALAPWLDRIGLEYAGSSSPYLYFRRRWVATPEPWSGADGGAATADSIGIEASRDRWNFSYWLWLEDDRGVANYWEPDVSYGTRSHDLSVGVQMLPTAYLSADLSASSMKRNGEDAWSSLAPGIGLHWTPTKHRSLALYVSRGVATDAEWDTSESYSSLSSEIALPLYLGGSEAEGPTGRLVLGHDLYLSGYEAPEWAVYTRDQSWAVRARVEFPGR